MSISVKNLTKIYGEQRALDDISFELQPGGIVGFLGPNGAGKSTTMKILTGYLPQTSGEAYVAGYDVSENPLAVKKRIGYLPEHNPLYLDMYVREYLSFIGGLHKLKNKKDRVEEIIKTVGLSLESKKRIGALSKGYRQRVGLAQALIHDPEVLILDEPTSGLDPNQISEIRDLIKSTGKDRTVMMSTHIMQEVEAICDRVIIVNHGKIVADNSIAELRGGQANQQIVAVEFGSEVSQEKLSAAIAQAKIKKVSNTQYRLAAEDSVDLRKAVFEFAVNNDLDILTIQKEEQSLESVFKKLTA